MVTQLGALNDFVVSPQGQWVAGAGASGPGDPVATTVYVLGVGAKKCLVVPGTSADAAGFTRDGKAVIVQRGHSGKEHLRQFALSSLHGDCPPRQVETQRSTSMGN
jgi:sugar lactone lactonase YvrE